MLLELLACGATTVFTAAGSSGSITAGTYEYEESNVGYAERKYEMFTPEHRTFVISYKYSTAHAMIPATNPPGEPHYDATIAIWEEIQINSKATTRRLIKSDFYGTYVPGGCFEDKPESLVKEALGWQWNGREYVQPIPPYQEGDFEQEDFLL